jgi:hypothetical protein
MFRQVDAVNGQKVQAVTVQAFKAQLQLRFKGNDIVAGRNFALQQTLGIGCLGKAQPNCRSEVP